ncbi:hypothetical protein [Tenacibaculum maritimum]|uniref:Uncharacterized protein n=3 Tax=Tenacibaculum maritimum TaxID=107401 RepID=A0A2H1E7E3_9FLAO|nr:hypothetical protein [Tenacibaculum maritimum]SFZ80598.1 conserved protein of unknown function [Tenacibaculum maritimum NCIMB 2154]
MNNYFTILLLFLFITCKTVKRTIIITQKETILPVYALLSNDTQRIIRLCFPIKVNLKNTSSSEQSFIKINYQYNSITTPIGNFIKLYKEQNKVLEKISNNKKKTLFPKTNNNYVLYTLHYISKKTSSSKKLQTYTNKMLTTNKDTLHIGTVTEFRQKHPKLFQQLTKNDRISIQFLEGKKLGKPISIPVTW